MANTNISSSNSSAIVDMTPGPEQYPYPSDVDPASFVSTQLSNSSNYVAWKEEMLKLVEHYNMLRFIQGRVDNPQAYDVNAFEAMHSEWKRSDNLVKGWIFGTLSENVMTTVAGLQTANQVWNKLKYRMETGFHKYNKLCRALQMGDWRKAQGFLNEDKDAFTAELNYEGQRCLHVAIGNPKNTEVLTGLLDITDPNQLPYLVDNRQLNALHFAAVLGNTEVAKKLVNKNPYLLGTVHQDGYLPIHMAINNSHETTFKYLLKEQLNGTGGINLFEGERGAWLLCDIILAGFLDVAYDLLMLYNNLAKTIFSNCGSPLYFIATKREAYLSAKDYNFYQRFFISRFDKYDPLCRALKYGDWKEARNFLNLQDLITNDNFRDQSADNLANVNRLQEGIQPMDIENPEINRASPFTKCMKSYVNHVIAGIIGKFLEVSVLHLPHIKHLKKDKVEHNIALMILEFICEKVGELPRDHEKHFKNAYFKALENNTPEVVEQITRTFPQSILMEDDSGHMLSHLSIKNRSEKIYNFFVHGVTQNKYLQIVATDKDDNNLLHLAGKLAPLHVLNRVTGAALQMRRELQWFEDVKILMRPKEREAKNKDEATPIMVFRKEHEALKKEGEVWTKKVADSYIITAALIITIVFAAVINVPGGIKETTGKPNFQTMLSFTVFLVTDAISLFTATISLLFFLSILTARHAEEDFLNKIPFKLICGLLMLFISVTMMLIAFSAALIMSAQQTLIIVIITGIITCIPIITFMVLQLPLLFDLISSTWWNPSKMT